MKYRLIRFSTSGDVVLDKRCNAPNEHGDNVMWHQQHGGTAMLYDYSEQRWYEYSNQKPWITWVAMGDKPLPKYIEMSQLIGAL